MTSEPPRWLRSALYALVLAGCSATTTTTMPSDAAGDAGHGFAKCRPNSTTQTQLSCR
jgi:hypothetical protein